jgi:hypothetical protein
MELFDVPCAVHLGNMFNLGATKCTMYSLFLPSLALQVSAAICTHHQEHNWDTKPVLAPKQSHIKTIHNL